MGLQKGVVLVVSGPSGTGKGTILSGFKKKHKEIVFSVSATTRQPRSSEIEGVNYFFKTKDQFQQMIKKGALLEWVVYCDHYYGTPENFIMENIENGKDIVVEVEVEGAIKIKENFPESVLVFIMPPSFEDLYHRINKRGSETDETRRKRLETALFEVELAKRYDYMIVNENVQLAVDQLHCILTSQKHRALRNEAYIEKILKEGFSYER
jgi:guanylate kinase